MDDLEKKSEARKRFIENIFDTMEEIEDVASQNSAECAIEELKSMPSSKLLLFMALNLVCLVLLSLFRRQ